MIVKFTNDRISNFFLIYGKNKKEIKLDDLSNQTKDKVIVHCQANANFESY